MQQVVVHFRTDIKNGLNTQEAAKRRLAETNGDTVARKLATLESDFDRRIAKASAVLEGAQDQRIVRMKKGEIRNLLSQKERKVRDLKQKLIADVLVQRFAYGVLEVI